MKKDLQQKKLLSPFDLKQIYRFGTMLFFSLFLTIGKAQTTLVILENGDTINFHKHQLAEHEDQNFDGVRVFIDRENTYKVEVSKKGRIPDGYRAVYDANGIRKLENLSEGNQFGASIDFYENGSVESILNYDQNGKLDGVCLYFSQDGKLEKTIRFRHGELIPKE